MNPLESYRLRRKIRRAFRIKFQLSKALTVAAFFSLSSPRTAYGRFSAAFKVWLKWAQHSTKTPFFIYYQRIRTCHRCPIFYAPLATCGSPLSKDLNEMGCWCHMPTKAAIIDANCWTREQGIDDGWSDDLTRLSGAEFTPKRKCGSCSKNSAATQHSGAS